MGNQRIGRIKNMAEGTIVLLQAYHRATRIVALKVGHIAHIGAAKSVNRLIIVAHRKYRCAAA